MLWTRGECRRSGHASESLVTSLLWGKTGGQLRQVQACVKAVNNKLPLLCVLQE